MKFVEARFLFYGPFSLILGVTDHWQNCLLFSMKDNISLVKRGDVGYLPHTLSYYLLDLLHLTFQLKDSL